MGNRHIPRLCRSCAAPMAGQEATCWSCGAAYAPAEPAAAPVVMTHDDRMVDRVVLHTPRRARTGVYNGATRIG